MQKLLVEYEGQTCQVTDNRIITMFGEGFANLYKAFELVKRIMPKNKVRVKNSQGCEMLVAITACELIGNISSF